MTVTDSIEQREPETVPAAFRPRDPGEAGKEVGERLHFYGPGMICGTEDRGYATPRNLPPRKLVVDVSEGRIPLWAPDTTLRWRFHELSFIGFEDPRAAQAVVRDLVAEAILTWGTNVTPVRFTEDRDVYDFRIRMNLGDECFTVGNQTACAMARAFFPGPGRTELVLFPRLFQLMIQNWKEAKDVMCHEMGHMFGLRHYFAQVQEADSPSEVFGTHKPFTIMNYGEQSEMTAEDQRDLYRLYQEAWSGELKAINGTPIRLVKPYHSTVG